MSQKNKVKNIIWAAVLLLLIAALIIVPAVLKNGGGEKENNAVILSTQVEKTSIQHTVSASGTLEEQEGEIVELPEGVELTRYLVKNGQYVLQGDGLAEIDRVTTMATIISIQKEMENLDAKIQAAASDVYTSRIASTAQGRVKAVYAQVGDNVRDVVREHGALAVLSLDGLMSLQLDCEALQEGDTVTVTTSDGKEYPGRTESTYAGIAVITLTDEGPLFGDNVTVSDGGVTLGKSTLSVHSAWNVTAIGGTVSSVNTKEEMVVFSGTPLFNLTEVKDSTGYNALVTKRREYENKMFDLFRIYQTGTIQAPCDGCVEGLDEAKVGLLESEGTYQIMLLGINPPPAQTAGVIDKVGIIAYSDPLGALLHGYTSTDNSVDYQVKPELTEEQMLETFMINPMELMMSGVPIFQWNEKKSQFDIMPKYSFDANGELVLAYYAEIDEETGTPKEEKLIWGVYWPFKMPDINWGGFGGFDIPEKPEEFTLNENQLMRIVPQETVTAELTVDEMDILSIQPGQEAEVLIDALPGRAFTAVVTDINSVGSNTGGHTKYKVTISLPKEENMLDGMNVTVVLSVGESESILSLPTEALVEKGRKTVVYTAYDAKSGELKSPVEVETGISDGTNTEILSGLEEGDVVWYSYYATAAMTLFSGNAENT